MNLELSTWIWAVALVIFTGITIFTDLRSRRIPNKITVPFFFAGILFQAFAFGWSGLGNAALAFLIGFGTLYVMWLVGAGGGGDVKLMGAVSVWLGPWMTAAVLGGSVLFTGIWAITLAAYFFLSKGMRQTRNRYIWKASQRDDKYASGKRKRRIVAYAVPVGFATCLVVAVQIAKEMGVAG